MKRKFLYLVAAIAELARFLALLLLSADFGAIGEGGGFPRLFRYAAAPQLLFAAAFFFLWLDEARYGPYRPLAAIGKLALLAAALPLGLEVAYSFVEPGSGLRDPGFASLALGFSLAVDLFGLGLAAPRRPESWPAAAAEAPLPAAPPAGAAESVPAAMPEALPEAGR
ncbi:MAG TPA: hypothetical protein P5133_09860, partial [Spirochaetia bacterium]|nr:hypothetical protein [Spirochaetia bacterium]